MNFTLGMPRRILFGAGSMHRLDDFAHPLGKRFLIVMSRSIARETKIDEILRGQLTARGDASAVVTATGEPEVADVDSAVITARSFGADCVIGIGGGSVLDLAKTVAAIAPQMPVNSELVPVKDSVANYLEGVGTGKVLEKRPLSLVLAPTTAGTGSEATRNSVISSREQQFKKSLRSDSMLADLAVVDPDLCRSCPKEVIAASGLDAITQLIEPYLSNGANPVVDDLIARALPAGFRALPIAFRDPIGCDPHIWDDLCTASLTGGIALTNAGLGSVHGFASAIGARYPIAHGTICAALLAPCLEANRNALLALDANHPKLERMAQVGRWLTGRNELGRDQAIGHGIDAIRRLAEEFGIPRLGELGLNTTDYPALVADSKTGSSMKFNPVQLTNAQLEWALEQAR